MRGGSLLLAVVLASGFASVADAAERIELPPGPNRDLVYARCRVCHDLQYLVESAGITRDNWVALIKDMGNYGLRITDDERDKIIAYLVTYLGPNPPKSAPVASAVERSADGNAVYARQCTSCHQPEGSGVSNVFPPLAANPDLFLDRLFPVYVLLNGLSGPITVKGENYRGVMPPFDHLSDAEIAAVVAYVRGAWGNNKLRPQGFVDVDAAAVDAARRQPMKPDEVHAYRAARR